MGCDIIEVNVFISPLKVMNYSFISQLFLHYEDVLKEVYYSFFYIKMIELCYHCFLIF